MKKTLFKILAVVIGLILGAGAGGYLGLVIGGTFLGGLDLYQKIGIEGYELATYIGIIIGAVVGINIALRIIKGRN